MPRKTVCVEYKHADFTLRLTQTGPGRFTVNYGLSERRNLTYPQAAKELGECIMHALCCEGQILVDGKEVATG